MARQVSYPGVYIDEFAPAAPIQGVGTNVAAFLGVTTSGDINSPRLVTGFDEFKQVFGDQPIPGFYLWYAVRGFFECKGQQCYIVRTSNGTYGTAFLIDANGNNVIRVRARQPGSMAITVAVALRHLLLSANTSVFEPSSPLLSVAPNGIDVNLNSAPSPLGTEAGKFRPGDRITISGTAQRATIVRISGDTLRVDTAFTGPFGPTVQLANPRAGDRTIRITSSVPVLPGSLVPGTALTIDPGGPNEEGHIVDSVQTEFLPSNVTTYRVTFRDGLRGPLNLGAPIQVQSEEFDLTITQPSGPSSYTALSIDAAYPRYVLNVINNDPASAVVLDLVQPPPTSVLPQSIPANASAFVLGLAENLATLADNDFITSIDSLRQVYDVNLIAIPDRRTTAVQQALISHCEQMADRFAVLDSAINEDFPALETHRQGLDSTRGYAALYYPWLQVPPFGSGGPILVPPSGHVCGIIARSDEFRGVHKAPANEIVDGALGVERSMSDEDQGILNLQGINVIRVFRNGARPILWGARTTATDTNWQYVNIRRLFLFLEKSIQEGIRWAVFEPNNTGLWAKLRRSISDFLTRVWRDGALFGETADKAFYVRIDDVLNPPSTQALGRLYIEIGVRPSYPAEFIIVRIGIWYGGTEVTES